MSISNHSALEMNGSNGETPNSSHVKSLTSNSNKSSDMNSEDSGSFQLGNQDSDNFITFIASLITNDVLVDKDPLKNKVVDFLHPDKLSNKIKFDLEEDPIKDEQIRKICKSVVRYSVKTGHTYFYNQLFGGFNLYSYGASMLSEALNTSGYTFEVAPVFTLMEKAVLKRMSDLIGFETHDGIFTPGGSMSNMMSINMARYHHCHDIKWHGMTCAPNLCLIISDQAHYSSKKAAAFLGLGVNNCLVCETDCSGRMSIDSLKATIARARKEGKTPFAVVATSATTVLGAFDPLDKIADVCAEEKIWLHVDACLGASVVFSPNYKHLVEGINRADSVSWNMHKIMAVPLQCSVLLTKHLGLLNECYAANADYLFQKDKFYDMSYDTGDKTIQCGRKIDAFKLWLMWKSKGDLGFQQDIENVIEKANYFSRSLKRKPNFDLLAEPPFINVCFWYIPTSLLSSKPRNQNWIEALDKVAPAIKQAMIEKGSMMLGYQKLKDRPNCFRMTVTHTDATEESMDFVLDEIERLGEAIDEKTPFYN